VDIGYSVAQTTDGGYIVAGWTWSFGLGEADIYIVKTDSLGGSLWTRTHGGIYAEEALSILQAADGGYVIAGYTESLGAGGKDVYLMKTDSLGYMDWDRTYGGPDDDEGMLLKATIDSGYVIAGRTSSFGAGGDDVYLIKTDADGLIGANHPPDLVDQADTTVAENQYLAFTLEAMDPDGDSLLFLSPDMPAGATLDSVAGLFEWTPTYQQAGLHTVTFIATEIGDSALADTEQTDITVGDVNLPPDLTDQPDTTIAEEEYLTFTLEASDPDGDSIRFSSPDLPGGATLDSVAGLFEWTPDPLQSGLYTVTFIATDYGEPALADTEDTDITVTDAVGVAGGDDEARPLAQYLAQNRPNPFGASTMISYSLRARQQVSLCVYDIRGALVRELVDEPVVAGVHRVTWDGRDGRGKQVSSGIYFCRMEAGEFSETRRMVLLR
jgi:hypothetical protein